MYPLGVPELGSLSQSSLPICCEKAAKLILKGVKDGSGRVGPTVYETRVRPSSPGAGKVSPHILQRVGKRRCELQPSKTDSNQVINNHS